MMTKKEDIVQIYNPRVKRWVKVDTKTAKIISRKKSEGKYKGVPEGKMRDNAYILRKK